MFSRSACLKTGRQDLCVSKLGSMLRVAVLQRRNLKCTGASFHWGVVERFQGNHRETYIFATVWLLHWATLGHQSFPSSQGKKHVLLWENLGIATDMRPIEQSEIPALRLKVPFIVIPCQTVGEL